MLEHTPSESEDVLMPPVKKRRLKKNTEHASKQDSGIDESTSIVRKRSKLEVPCHEMIQFQHKDFQGILKMYIEHRENVSNAEILFQTTEDDGRKIDGSNLFLTVCEVSGESGKGLGVSKKKSKAMACLDVIQKLGLVPEEYTVNTLAVPAPRNPKRVKPVVEMGNYLHGDFKSALLQHLKKKDPEDELLIQTSDQIFVTTCKTTKGGYQGRGEALTKKKSVHLACLDLMLNMGLVTKEQIEKHPCAKVTEWLEKKTLDETHPR